jgi:hypothetical protein
MLADFANRGFLVMAGVLGLLALLAAKFAGFFL